MEIIKQNKILISIFILIIIAFFAYTSLSKDNKAILSDPSEEVVGQDILVLLEKIQQVQIDNTLFASSIWISLKDFSVQIPNDIPGKLNLFGPLGKTDKTGGATTTRTTR